MNEWMNEWMNASTLWEFLWTERKKMKILTKGPSTKCDHFGSYYGQKWKNWKTFRYQYLCSPLPPNFPMWKKYCPLPLPSPLAVHVPANFTHSRRRGMNKYVKLYFSCAFLKMFMYQMLALDVSIETLIKNGRILRTVPYYGQVIFRMSSKLST